MPLKDTTFGNSKAAINLAKILNEIGNSAVTTKVTKFLSQKFRLINSISKNVSDRKLRKYIFLMMRRSIDKDGSGMIVPEKIKTHTHNVLIGRLRDEINRKV